MKWNVTLYLVVGFLFDFSTTLQLLRAVSTEYRWILSKETEMEYICFAYVMLFCECYTPKKYAIRFIALIDCLKFSVKYQETKRWID